MQSPARVKPASLKRHVEHLCQLAPRDYAHLDNLNAAADYINREWTRCGLKVTQQNFQLGAAEEAAFPLHLETHLEALNETFALDFELPKSGSTFKNLLVEIPGNNSSTRPLLIGAHYDAVAMTPGADDNASGVAGLLELGRLFAASKPKIPVMLVAWTNEEQPFFSIRQRGSDYHARLLKSEKRQLSGAISLEMIGRYYDDPHTQRYPNAFLQWLRRKHDRGNFIAFVSTSPSCALVKRATRNFRRVSHFPVHAAVVPERLGGPRVLGSDHHSYMLEGYAAMMITDTAENRGHPEHGTTYHTPKDTPDTLNYEYMALLVEGLYDMVQEWR